MHSPLTGVWNCLLISWLHIQTSIKIVDPINASHARLSNSMFSLHFIPSILPTIAAGCIPLLRKLGHLPDPVIWMIPFNSQQQKVNLHLRRSLSRPLWDASARTFHRGLSSPFKVNCFTVQLNLPTPFSLFLPTFRVLLFWPQWSTM